MHVGFGLLTLFPNRVGGTETYVRALLAEYARGNGPERLTALANRHVASDPAYRALANERVRIHRVRSYRSGDRTPTRALALAAARLAPRLVARDVPEGLDVLHLPVTVPVPRLALPTVVTVHELYYYEMPDDQMSRAERRYRRWAYDGSARAATRVIAISGYVADRLAEHSPIPRERIEVVHCGVDHERFRPEADPLDDELLAPLELPRRFLFYPATFLPHKNHSRLIEALASTPGDGLSLVLAGRDDGLAAELDELVRRLGVADRVRRLPHLDAPTLAALYRRAQATVFPSLAEGFGLPPLEAMASGCPVASAKNTSLLEVCGDSVVELQPEDPAQMADAIAQIADDESLRGTLRERGLERAARFNWADAAAQHTEIYARVAAT